MRGADLVADERDRVDGPHLRGDEAAERLRRHQRFADGSVETGVSRAIIPSLAFELGAPNAMSPDAVRSALASGRYRAFGEVLNQYRGFDPSDPAFDPYLAIVEELDIPMSIHVGIGPPGAPYFDSPKYRARLHSPLTIEEALIKPPKLRVSLMHAGWPMLDDLLAVMWTHPQVYVDVGAISVALPPVAARWR